MATLRLGDAERSNINNAFARVLERAQNNQKFPLEEEDIEDFGMSLLSDKAAECFSYLKEFEEDLVRTSSYNPNFKIRGSTFEYDISLWRVELPRDNLLVPEQHAAHAEILEWVTQYCIVQKDIADARDHVREIVAACSSVGQIKRIMQDEILRFVPQYMRETFGNAERRSRVPSGFEIEPDKLTHLSTVLALGTLSPESEGGVSTSVNRTPI